MEIKSLKNCETKTLADENSRNAEEIVIPHDKRQEILNELRPSIIKRNFIKYLNY